MSHRLPITLVLMCLAILLLPTGTARSDEDAAALRARVRALQGELREAREQHARELSELKMSRAEAREACERAQKRNKQLEQALYNEQKQRNEDITRLQEQLTEIHSKHHDLRSKYAEMQSRAAEVLSDLVGTIGAPAVPTLLANVEQPKIMSALQAIGLLEDVGAAARSALPALRALAASKDPEKAKLAEAAARAVRTIQEALAEEK